MRINSVEQKGYANRIMDWKIFVRQDLVVAKASEFFYEFVGENSFRPVSELLLPEDGELLKKAVEADTFQPLELITVLHNLKDSVRNVYLRLEQSEQTENGIPLYQITVSDIHDLENRNLRLEQSILKYRHFMTLEDVYFFEYLIEQDSITVYKYVNERAMNQFEGPMNALIRNVEQAHEGSDMPYWKGSFGLSVRICAMEMISLRWNSSVSRRTREYGGSKAPGSRKNVIWWLVS